MINLFKLAEISWSDAQELFKEVDVAILPVGSTEQHGPHNPLGTDHLVAAALSGVVGEKTGVPVLPVVPVGVSEHHRQFPGTLWVPPRVFEEYVKAVALAAAGLGVKKIIIVNGHGGNTGAISQALREIKEETGETIYSLMVFPGERGFGSDSVKILKQEGGGHACEMETSIALYLGQRVLREEAVKWEPPRAWTEFDRKYRGKVSWTRDFHESTETGNLGDPTIATEEKGRQLVEAVVDEISAFIEDLKAKKD